MFCIKKRVLLKIAVSFILIQYILIFSVIALNQSNQSLDDTEDNSIYNDTIEVDNIDNETYSGEESNTGEDEEIIEYNETDLSEENSGDDEENITEHNETYEEIVKKPELINTVLNILIDKASAIIGETINIKAYLSYENESPIENKPVHFYVNELPIGVEVTDDGGLAYLSWDTTNISPMAYIIQARYYGDDAFNGSISDNVELEVHAVKEDKESEDKNEIPFNISEEINISQILSNISEEINETVSETNETLIFQSNMSLFSSEYKEEEILDTKRSKDELPREIVQSSNKYLQSFVIEDDLNRNLRFAQGLILENSTTKKTEYLLIYYLRIEYYRENGKRTGSVYTIQVKVDKNGNVIDSDKPKELYKYLKERGT